MADVRVNDYSLMRARDGRMLGGVAAGLAKACGLDVVLVRLCIAAMVLSGFGVPAYILMWIILPEESPRRGRVIAPAPESTARIIRIALIALGVLSVFNKMGGFMSFANPHTSGVGFDGAIGLILLGIGIAILFTRHRPDRDLWQPAATETDTVTTAASADDDPPKFAGPFADAMGTVHGALSDAFSEVRTTLAESKPRGSTAAYADDDISLDDDYLDEDVDIEREPTRVAVATADGDVRHAGGAALAWARVVGWLLLIWWSLSALGLVGLWVIGAVGVRSPVLLGVAGWLVFVAVLNTLLHAKFARAIVPSLALLLIPMGVAAATVRPVGDIGRHITEPQTIPQATKNYRIGIGRLDLDYATTDFANRNTTINARVGAGAIFVEVPNDVAVKVNARTGTGGYEIFGRESDGVSPRETINSNGCEGAKTLTLNLRTGAGYIQVHRANGHSNATCAAA
jgi:phage shock protein PspC (stress-responsive transcriptional regulator)